MPKGAQVRGRGPSGTSQGSESSGGKKNRREALRLEHLQVPGTPKEPVWGAGLSEQEAGGDVQQVMGRWWEHKATVGSELLLRVEWECIARS